MMCLCASAFHLPFYLNTYFLGANKKADLALWVLFELLNFADIPCIWKKSNYMHSRGYGVIHPGLFEGIIFCHKLHYIDSLL